MKRLFPLFFALLLFSGCGAYPPEEVDLAAILPEGGVNELSQAYPDLTATIVQESDFGVAVGNRYLELTGIEEDERRDRTATWIAGYLNDPEKRDREARERAEYDALPAADKLAAFVVRMEGNYPGFDYEWTTLEGGNSFVEYGDNGLLLTGVEDEGARREIGNYIYRLQQEIDAGQTGEQE